jgi:hypothetical protein
LVAVYNQPESNIALSGPIATGATIIASGAVKVQFSLEHAANGLYVNASAACPSVVLGVYCSGGGFELQGSDNMWSVAAKVEIASDDPTAIVVTPTKGLAGAAKRVRYAYADWPVVFVRNGGGLKLPTRLFNIPVAAGKTRVPVTQRTGKAIAGAVRGSTVVVHSADGTTMLTLDAASGVVLSIAVGATTVPVRGSNLNLTHSGAVWTESSVLPTGGGCVARAHQHMALNVC